MYLKRIEIQGFKSFADKTVLEFPNGVTTIVGPNGSGKSNISDSIRWVLGEQSAKVLRGSRMEDIIFAGTQNRKPVSFAEVSMVLDNTSRLLPIEYDEVTVTRRVYRSNESEYYINKTACRLKDVQELFMDTGIGKDGYSIISQGKIDEILSNKSEDRRNVFEEAAGIVKYRTRKLEAQKKLENTNINISRISDVLREIETNIASLENQAKKAKRYLELRDELKELELGLFVNNVQNIQQQLDSIKEQYDIANNQIIETENNIKTGEENKKIVKEKIDNLILEIEEHQNMLFDTKNINEKNNNEISISTEKIANNKENIERFENEIASDSEKIKLLEEEKEERRNKKASLIENKVKFEEELIIKQEELDSLVTNLSDREIEIENIKQRINNNDESIFAKKSSIEIHKNNIENADKRLKQIDTEKSKSISNVDARRLEKEELEKALSILLKNKNDKYNKLIDVQNSYNEANTKVNDINNEYNNIINTIRLKDSRKQLLVSIEKDHEGYARSTKAVLDYADKSQSFKKGICDAVGNLVKTEADYEIAIEVALGASMQNIVVENEEAAKKCISYLKENKLGRSTFMPLTTIKPYKMDNLSKAKKMNGYIGVANEIISFDKEYTNVFSNLLGRTVIVDNIDNGLAIAKANNYTFRIVTLQGEVLSNNGSMTGGSLNARQTGMLGKSREIQLLTDELEKLDKRKEELSAEHNVLAGKLEGLKPQLEELRNEYREFELEYAAQNQKVISSINNIERLDEYIMNTDDEKTTLRELIQSSNAAIIQIENEIECLNKENETLNKEVEEYTRYNKDKQVILNNLNEDIVNLRISLTSFDESAVSMEEIFDRIENDIIRYREDIAKKTELITILGADIKRQEERIKELKDEIINSSKTVKTIESDIEKLKQERQGEGIRLDKIERDIGDFYDTINILKDNLSRVESKKVKHDLELDALKNRMWEEYEITISSAEELLNKGLYNIENVNESNKQAGKLRKAIKDLGSINIDSIEEYKKVSERYEFMKVQEQDLEETSNKLKKLISDITHVMKEQFEIQFNIINKNFNETFVKLFGGGKAELKLLDASNILECGIDIAVQPPGKKLQNMMLLSGGERAFTAIALLFAILKLKASPFCILDEIEAALDDVNVYRFAEYIKEYSEKTQFIIITHRKGTMEAADTIYGVTMQEYGISKLVSMNLKDSEK